MALSTDPEAAGAEPGRGHSPAGCSLSSLALTPAVPSPQTVLGISLNTEALHRRLALMLPCLSDSTPFILPT